MMFRRVRSAVAPGLLSLRRIYLEILFAAPCLIDGHLVCLSLFSYCEKVCCEHSGLFVECVVISLGGIVGNGTLGHRAGVCLVL